MRKYYRDVPRGSSGRALKLAYTALAVIALLIIICLVELVVLASVSARVRAAKADDPEPPPVDSSTPPPEDTSTPGGEDSSSTEVYAPVSPARLGETEDYGQEYINKIIFVGDSTTYGLKAYGMLSGGKNTTQVWTPASGTYSLNALVATYKIVYPETGEELTVADAAAKAKPEYMVITLGINYGVPYCGETEFKKYYRLLLDDIVAASPETKIMLQSIYPVATNNELRDITNEKIDLANQWIEQLAEEYGLKYLHTNPTLKDTDGYLFQSYQNGDGLHLLERGFNAVLQYIRTHGYPKN
ncbi:MAG: hypothetical protein IJY27_06880 [Clostridia bacterium]|nr:hypothetical protein [Clostridia bacterium]